MTHWLLQVYYSTASLALNPIFRDHGAISTNIDKFPTIIPEIDFTLEETVHVLAPHLLHQS